KLPSGREREDASEHIRFREGFWILDRQLNVEVTEIRTPVTFNHVHRIAMRLTGGIQPGFVVETHGVDDKSVTFPLADGLPGPALGLDIEVMRTPIQEKPAIAVRVSLPEQRDRVRT